jgi:hypothetical protein
MSISGHRQLLFGGALQTIVSDRSAGIVHPDHPEFATRIGELLAESGAGVILAQSLEMKTGIADLRAGAPLEAGKVPGFIRTKDKADGVIFPAGGIEMEQVRTKVAALLMVGDSPGITVYDPDNDVIGFLNGSMECLDPADGSDGIVTKLVEMLRRTGSDPRHIGMAVSACAQACCFGYDMSTAQNAARRTRLTDRYGADVITSAITYPPRTGNGIDLGLIAKRQAELAGIDHKRPSRNYGPVDAHFPNDRTSQIRAEYFVQRVIDSHFFVVSHPLTLHSRGTACRRAAVSRPLNCDVGRQKHVALHRRLASADFCVLEQPALRLCSFHAFARDIEVTALAFYSSE